MFALACLRCTTLLGIDKDYTAATPEDAGVDTSTPPPTGELRVKSEATRLVLHQGESKDLDVSIERGADPGPASIAINKLPAGVTTSPLVIVPGQTRGTIRLSAATTTPIGPVSVTIVATIGAAAVTTDLALVMVGAPGALDPSLGTNGIASVSLGGRFTGLGRTAQGRILLGGANATALIASALSNNGAIDGPYGSGGIATATVGTNAGPGGGFLTADESFCVAGTANVDGGTLAALTRFTPAGALDTTFGSGGLRTYAEAGQTMRLNAVAQGLAGTIVFTGSVTVAGEKQLVVGRTNAAGDPDPAFGAARVVDLSGTDEEGLAVAVQPDGKIVVAGQTNLAAKAASDFFVARLNADGTLDTTFGTGGVATIDFGAFEDGARGVALQTDGAIVVVGGTKSPSSGTSFDIAIVRLLSNGSIDAAFGKRTYPVGGGDDFATAVAIQTNGRIVVLGETNSSAGIPDVDFALLRCETDGTLDTKFGIGGKVVTNFGGNDHGRALLLVGDTQILAGGFDDTGSGLVARHWQ